MMTSQFCTSSRQFIRERHSPSSRIDDVTVFGVRHSMTIGDDVDADDVISLGRSGRYERRGDDVGFDDVTTAVIGA